MVEESNVKLPLHVFNGQPCNYGTEVISGQPRNYGTEVTPTGLQESGAPVVEVADVIESFGFRVYHVGLLLVIWCVLTCPAAVTSGIPFVMSPLQQEFGINHAQTALVGSALTSGAVIGVLIFGRVNDLYGRRQANLIAVILIGLLSACHLLLPAVSGTERGSASALKIFTLLVALRACIGFFFAGPASFALLLFAEFLPSKHRGLMMTVANGGWSFGSLLGICMASQYETNWRMILAAPAMASVVAILALSMSPESVRWLFVVGKEEEGRRVLQHVLSSRLCLALDDSKRVFETVPPVVKVSAVPTASDSPSRRHGQETDIWADVRSLFGPKLRRATFCAAVLQISVQGSSYVMLIWVADILKVLLGSSRAPYEIFVYAEVAGWIGTASAAVMLDKIGRRAVLTYSLSATSGIIMAMVLLPRRYHWITMCYLASQIVSGGIWPAMLAYVAECFPTTVRGTGGALCQACGRASAMLLPILVGAVLDGGLERVVGLTSPIDLVLRFVAGMNLVGAVAAALIPQETANCKMVDL